MSIKITYWTVGPNENMPGRAILSETITVTGTSAQSGVTPEGVDAISLLATSVDNFAYGVNPTATAATGANGHPLALGERVWIDPQAGWKFAGITAT